MVFSLHSQLIVAEAIPLLYFIIAYFTLICCRCSLQLQPRMGWDHQPLKRLYLIFDFMEFRLPLLYSRVHEAALFQSSLDPNLPTVLLEVVPSEFAFPSLLGLLPLETLPLILLSPIILLLQYFPLFPHQLSLLQFSLLLLQFFLRFQEPSPQLAFLILNLQLLHQLQHDRWPFLFLQLAQQLFPQ